MPGAALAAPLRFGSRYTCAVSRELCPRASVELERRALPIDPKWLGARAGRAKTNANEVIFSEYGSPYDTGR